MSQKLCTCPSYEGLTYDEIITVSGLLKRKSESRNCCEPAGYICSTLDKALREAEKVRDRKKRLEKGKKKDGTSFSSGYFKGNRTRVLRKRKLSV